MEIEIRHFAEADTESLIEVFDAVLPGFTTSLLDPEGPVDFLGDTRSFAFGAFVGDEPAGLAWGVQMLYPNGRLVTYLHELDVRQEFRRRGLATLLVEKSMALARHRGSTRFWLSTGGQNEVAQSVYDSLSGVRKPLGDVNYWWDL
jgi:ribosomal protein S18 acetylase RimI-like enzyme